MGSKRLESVVLVALSWLSVAGCDPVRPGDFEADYPANVWIDLPAELRDVARTAADVYGSQIWLDEGTARVRSTRQWDRSPAGPLLLGYGQLTSPLEVPLWRDLVWALDQGNWNPRFSKTDLGMADSAYGGPTTVIATVRVAVQPSPGGKVLLYSDVDDVMIASQGGTDLQPIGPAGPTLAVPAGFHRYRRTCTPAGQESFAEVPIDDPVELVSVGWVDVGPQPLSAGQGTTDYGVALCGIDVGTAIDMGTAVPLPKEPSLSPYAVSADSLAWTPGGDGLYVMGGVLPGEVYYLDLGDQSWKLIASGEFKGPMTVAMDGTSLLYWTDQGTYFHYTRQSLSDTMLPLQASLPSLELHPTDPPGTVLSPDGYVLASGSGMDFTDLRTLTRPTLKALVSPGYYGIPLAWAPTGDAILMELSPQHGSFTDGVDNQFATASLTITAGVPSSAGPPTPLAAEAIPEFLRSGKKSTNGENRDGGVRYFWSASGPQVLIQDKDGTRVYNFATQKTLVMVDPTHVPPPTASTAAVVSTDQVFAWDLQCFGIGETHCRAELRRLSLASGAIDTVARADQPWMFAVSPDGRQIAFVEYPNLYLKTIGP